MKKSKTVRIGKLEVGGANPVRVKGMLKAPATKISQLIEEGLALQHQGAEAVRVAVQREEDARLAGIFKKHFSIPVAADIHFQPKLAFLAIKSGFDQIRINPLNIYNPKDIKEIARLAKEKKISIRVGVNSGGFRDTRMKPDKLARRMIGKCIDCIELLESQNFSDIMVSLKSSDIESALIANRVFSAQYPYPLHLGITATGSYLEGVVKSSVGLGILLSEGIGDIIRVSLTGDSLSEIKAAQYILQALNLRKFGPEIISCPTCSRCEVDLPAIVGRFRKRLEEIGYKKPLRIAVMGCVVNGPGEAVQADLGVAFGKKIGVLFKRGKVFRKTKEGRVIDDLIRELEAYE